MTIHGVSSRMALFVALTSIALVSHAQTLMNRADPLPGVTTAGQPDAAALEALAKQGYVAVVDLRTPEEDRGLDERKTVEELGMSYIPLPVAGADGLTYDNATVLDQIMRDAKGPVLIHCATSNRVGGLLSLVEHLRGASPEDSLAKGVEAGLKSPALRSAVEEHLTER